MNKQTEVKTADSFSSGLASSDAVTGSAPLSQRMEQSPLPEIMRTSMLSMQVCVPAVYTAEQVESFANSENPAGTEHGWRMRRQGDPALAGCDERVKCAERAGCVHIMLDC